MIIVVGFCRPYDIKADLWWCRIGKTTTLLWGDRIAPSVFDAVVGFYCNTVTNYSNSIENVKDLIFIISIVIQEYLILGV